MKIHTFLRTKKKKKNQREKKKINGCILHKTSTILLSFTLDRESARIYYLPLAASFFSAAKKKIRIYLFTLSSYFDVLIFMTYTRKTPFLHI